MFNKKKALADREADKLEKKNVKAIPQQEIAKDEKGNGHSILEALNKLRDSGVIQKFEERMSQQQEEKTKYTVLHDLSSTDEDKIKMHTDLNDTEILILNKLHMWGLLAPRVFGNSEKNKEIVSFVTLHAREHRLNKMSKDRKREFSLVHAVRGDNTVSQTESAIQKVFKYK